jgi:ArsR family transcriptional regulator
MARAGQHTAPSAPLLPDEAETLAEFMAAFSTGSRLRLLYALVTVERTVEDLAEETGLSPNVVSQQLRVLRLLRLVQARRDGRHMRYRLFDDHVADLLAAIRHHGEHVEESMPAARRGPAAASS